MTRRSTRAAAGAANEAQIRCTAWPASPWIMVIGSNSMGSAVLTAAPNDKN